MSLSAINFAEKLSHVQDHWSPRVIAELNNYQFKLAKLKGEFVWHQHDDTDEAFIVMHGQLAIELEDQVVNLAEGEMFIVPRGVSHKPIAEEECHVLLIEPRGVVNTGEADTELTAQNDVWI